MSIKWTMDQWVFALGIYPSFNAIDRYSMFLEMLENYVAQTSGLNEKSHTTRANKKIKKLSQQKKASFAAFLEETDIQTEMGKYRQQEISWTYLHSSDYPPLLKEIYAPPVVLFYQGNFDLIKEHTWLGVVGARDCTDYGLKAVEEIVSDLIEQSKQSLGIISGLAKGIDTKAHQETIKHKGQTIGVIGSGLDRYYPRQNRALQKEMAMNQLVLSEYPLGAKPLKYHFPERNRIIAGLSRGVLVIEARKRSGSLITAYNALEENRDVFAIPGSIFDSTNEGCHKLIQLGAILTKKSEDILQEWFII